jgi:hypothetical protein
LTLRELIGAAKAKQRYDWDHTADLLAMMANLHTTGSYSRENFHPTRESKKPVLYQSDPAAEYERLIKESKK